MEVCENTHKRTRTSAQTHITSLIPAGKDQFEWHKTSRMTGPECAVMCHLADTHTYIHTGRDCVVMNNIIDKHTHKCERHRMTRVTGQD